MAAQRADAVRSRERLLAAAREVVAVEGGSFSLDRVARRAGVGSATLYRHFPRRDELLDAVFQDHAAGLARFGAELADDHGRSSEEVLRAWFVRLVSGSIEMRGFAAAGLAPAGTDHPSCYDLVTTATQRLVERAERDSVLRPSVRTDELLQLVTGIVLAHPPGAPAARSLRLLDVVLAGAVEPS